MFRYQSLWRISMPGQIPSKKKLPWKPIIPNGAGDMQDRIQMLLEKSV